MVERHRTARQTRMLGCESWWFAAHAAAMLCLFTLLAAAASLHAAAPTPQHPALRFWFRGEHPASRDVSEMDARTVVLADALGAGDYRQLIPIAEGLIDVPGVAALAATYLVEAHLGQGDFESARGAAERLREVAPSVYAEEMGRIEEREHLRQRVVTALEAKDAGGGSADSPATQLQLGYLCAALGDRTAALACYRRVIRGALETRYARRALRQIALLVAPDMTDLDALAELDGLVGDKQGTESSSALCEIYREAAQALRRQGPTAEAATALQEALRFSSPGPARAEITLSLGEMFLQLGRYHEVHSALAGLAVESDPSLLEFRQKADYLDALAYHGDGDRAEARAILEEIVATPGPNPCREGAESLLRHLRQAEG